MFFDLEQAIATVNNLPILEQSNVIALKLRGGLYHILAFNANPQMVMHTDGRFKVPTEQALQYAIKERSRCNSRLEAFRNRRKIG